MFSESRKSGAFRAVEYSRGPDGEQIRMTNIEAMSHGGDEEIAAQALKIDRINSRNFVSTHNMQETRKIVTLTNEESYKDLKVKEDETQEMTMFVDNNKEDDLNLAFKIDLNSNNRL